MHLSKAVGLPDGGRGRKPSTVLDEMPWCPRTDGHAASLHARIWILIERVEDIPGEWVAHCLDFDAVMQGSSIREAFAQLAEAVKKARHPTDGKTFGLSRASRGQGPSPGWPGW